MLGARGRGEEEEEEGAVLPLGCSPCLPSQGWGRGYRLLGQVLHGDLLLARGMEGDRLLFSVHQLLSVFYDPLLGAITFLKLPRKRK